ncbi:MAG: hypothetical protein JW924_11950 [Fusobacteriaceae bacterium]|nr:hypothetical protein [Fusobacteriaceae bacterium]
MAKKTEEIQEEITETQKENYIYIGPRYETLNTGKLFIGFPEKELEKEFSEKPKLKNFFIKASDYPKVRVQLKDPNSNISLILKGGIN